MNMFFKNESDSNQIVLSSFLSFFFSSLFFIHHEEDEGQSQSLLDRTSHIHTKMAVIVKEMCNIN